MTREDFEVHESGTFKTLDEKDLEIRRLTAGSPTPTIAEECGVKDDSRRTDTWPCGHTGGATRDMAEDDWRCDECHKPVPDPWDDSKHTPSVCEWTDSEYDWKSGCGKSWDFEYDGPTENGVKFCMNCGKPVVITLVDSDQESP